MSKGVTEAIFAIDLGAIASGDPNVPVVNRKPEAFFRTTYLTSDLDLPVGIGLFDLARVQDRLQQILGAPVELIPSANLKPGGAARSAG
jgi:hypothetical protein